MRSLVVLIDTNVIIDVLTQRGTYCAASIGIYEKCALGEIRGYLAAHSIPNIFYILRKGYTPEERKEFIKDLCDIFNISILSKDKILAAADNDAFSDIEDGLQEECAIEAQADYIVTRDPAGFLNSRVRSIHPEELLELLSKGDTDK